MTERDTPRGRPSDRPEYGEYATPQEQEAAIRASGGVPERARATPARAQPAPSAPRPQPSPAARTRPAGLANRFVTIMLLTVGLFLLLQSAPGYLDLGASLSRIYDLQGIGDYHPTELTAALGVVALVVHAITWVASAWLAIALLRKGRQSWWVPLVGLVVGFLGVSIVIAFLLAGDPAFMAYVTTPTG